MTIESDAIRDLFTAKLAETLGDLSRRKVDSLAMVEALGAGFLSAAASCAPDRDEYERVIDDLVKARWEVWDRNHPN